MQQNIMEDSENNLEAEMPNQDLLLFDRFNDISIEETLMTTCLLEKKEIKSSAAARYIV